MQTNSTERPYHTRQWQTPDVSAIDFFVAYRERKNEKTFAFSTDYCNFASNKTKVTT